MTTDSDAAYRVQFCCSFCGNRSMRDVTTGTDVDIVLVLRRSDIEQAKAELTKARCVLCGEAVALVELGPADDPPAGPPAIATTIRTEARLVVACVTGTVRAS